MILYICHVSSRHCVHTLCTTTDFQTNNENISMYVFYTFKVFESKLVLYSLNGIVRLRFVFVPVCFCTLGFTRKQTPKSSDEAAKFMRDVLYQQNVFKSNKLALRKLADKTTQKYPQMRLYKMQKICSFLQDNQRYT